MDFPIGDIFRAFNPKGWLKKILDITKGWKIKAGDHTILLDENQGPAKPGESKFDRIPSKPKPPFDPR
jgi:hypothetical protein